MLSLALSSTSIAALLKGSSGIYLPFLPSGSTGLITADSLVFKVVGVATVPDQITDNMWALVPIAGGLRVDLAPYPDDGAIT